MLLEYRAILRVHSRGFIVLWSLAGTLRLNFILAEPEDKIGTVAGDGSDPK